MFVFSGHVVRFLDFVAWKKIIITSGENAGPYHMPNPDKHIPCFKCWKCYACCVGITILTFTYIAFTRSKHTIYLFEQFTVTCDAPSFAESTRRATWTLEFASNAIPVGQVQLHGSVQQQPVMVLPGMKAGEINCLYINDTHMEVVAFNLQKKHQGNSYASPLGRIVISSSYEVRRLESKDEFLTLATFVKSLDSKEIKRLSLPAPVGLFGLYTSRDDIVAHLEKRADPNFYVK